MHRITLATVTATASIALLAGCTTAAPEAEPTTAADLSADVPTLRAQIPTEVEPTPAPTPVQGELPEGYGYIFDDTGVLSVVTPTAWADVDGRPFSTSDGREWASLIATPDAAAYPSDWNMAGIEFSGTAVDGQLDEQVVKQFLTDLSAPLDQNCDALKTAQPYADGLYTGWFSNWNGCGEGDTFGIVVVAQDPQFHHLVFLRGKFVTEEDNGETFTQIFTTFQSTQGLVKAAAEDRVFTGE
ncbi:MAG TPA: hypothetical protein VNR36_01290 [Pseudolysinimonas sp.]|nr:hypothetical protein [Pseudolysinimonas sp.]